jgi:hypothetical protein
MKNGVPCPTERQACGDAKVDDLASQPLALSQQPAAVPLGTGGDHGVADGVGLSAG